eukprot:Protomagalhaensia_wolfi_Nauph_80__6174@NODE_90_length_3826_cov_233_019276_g64_i1_p3_GENE_NODE_90_length_3826_cov_233_019276_g64_i1NODE_90_length_3826_cov_233_019276_g64_i1_p3_ORF_typecomplete_len264_score26_36Brix/PF04427_18/0_023Zeta_toxin/PF06414_12/99Zeta_toxin/PF06414_12/1_6_NODE_90_length_3826_cov_233_019276_g64_i120852876
MGGRKPVKQRKKTKKPSQANEVSRRELKRLKRKKEYDAMKLPKMSLAERQALNLDKLKSYLPDLKGGRRSMLLARLYFEQKRRKSEKRRDRHLAEQRGEEVVRQEPITIENTRPEDDTMVDSNDEEVIGSNLTDEYQPFYDGGVTPKLLISTGKNPHKKLLLFLKEFVVVFPNCFYRPGREQSVEELVERAKAKGYSQLLIFVERHRKPYGVYMSQIPGERRIPECFQVTAIQRGRRAFSVSLVSLWARKSKEGGWLHLIVQS